MFDTIIVGGGPAGLTAAFSLGRSGRSVLLLEKNELGGQARVIETLENVPGIPSLSAPTFLRNLIEQANLHGAQFVFQEARAIRMVRGLFSVEATHSSFRSRSVLLATGARFRSLDLPDIERFSHHCPTPQEASAYSGKIVAIVGGGDVAFDRALLLSRYARTVYLLYRSAPRALPLLQERVRNTPSILCYTPYTVCALDGTTHLTSLHIRHMRDHTVVRLHVDALFPLIGKDPNDQLSLAHPGVFSCGDVVRGRSRHVTIACADGMQAALACEEYLCHTPAHAYADR